MNDLILLLRIFHARHWTKQKYRYVGRPTQDDINHILIENKGYISNKDRTILSMFVWEYWGYAYTMKEFSDDELREFIQRISN